jgi:hypothetical protein
MRVAMPDLGTIISISDITCALALLAGVASVTLARLFTLYACPARISPRPELRLYPLLPGTVQEGNFSSVIARFG